jgi:rubrerythrin
MYKDEIVEEIHKYREEYAKSFNYDLKAIFEDLRKKQIAHGRKVVKLPIKRSSKQSPHPTLQ